MAPYRFLYPGASDESLARIAYYFDFDYADGDDPRQRVAELIEQVDAWRARGECGTLGARPGGDGSLVLADTRPDAAHPLVTLHGLERAAYEYCDEIRSLPGVVRHLSTLFPDRPPAGSEQVRGFLDSLVANRLMVTDGAGHYLSLAIAPWEPPKRERPPPANRRGRRGTRRKTSARRLRLPMFLGAPAGASV
jgi:hypothetical protein